MTKIEKTAQQLVVQSGSTTLTLDKSARKATLRRKVLFWNQKPIERPLSDVSEVSVEALVDRASGVEVCNVMVVMAQGDAWAIPAADKKDATATAATTAQFLGIKPGKMK